MNLASTMVLREERRKRNTLRRAPRAGFSPFAASFAVDNDTVRRAMTGLYATLVSLHVTANVVWIGSILAVALVLAGSAGDAVVRGRLGYEVYRKVAAPAFVVSFVAGGIRLAFGTNYYFVQTKFMHGKLFLALVVIGLHHAIGARAKKMERGAAPDAGTAPILAAVLLVATVGIVFLVIAKPF
jgi:putative membrane protein